MAINLRELKKQKAKEPPRILMYGPPGMAKTSLASEFPNAIFIKTEDGTPGDREIVALPQDGRAASYNEVIGYISQLLSEDHDFTTVVLDSLDKLEPLVWAQVCDDNKWANIEEPGYGKGYAITDSYWRYLIDGLEALRLQKGMTIIFIAHSTIDRFESPTSASYNRYDIRLHKRALAIFQDEVDAIFFLNQDVTIKEEKGGFGAKTNKADGGGNIWIHTVGRPAFTAKNRYGIPARVMFLPFQGYSSLGKFLPAQAPEVSNDNHQRANDNVRQQDVADDQQQDEYVPPGEAAA